MSKYTTETATLKALVIDTNVLKINGFVFKPTMDGLTLTPPAPEPEEQEDDDIEGGQTEEPEQPVTPPTTEDTGGGNIIIGGGGSNTGGNIVIGGGSTQTIVQETTIVKEQKFKVISTNYGQLTVGVSTDVYNITLDESDYIITVKLFESKSSIKNPDEWLITKVLINGSQIMCPIHRETEGWSVKFAELGDELQMIYGGIANDSLFHFYITYTEQMETEFAESEEQDQIEPENPENPENPEETTE